MYSKLSLMLISTYVKLQDATPFVREKMLRFSFSI